MKPKTQMKLEWFQLDYVGCIFVRRCFNGRYTVLETFILFHLKHQNICKFDSRSKVFLVVIVHMRHNNKILLGIVEVVEAIVVVIGVEVVGVEVVVMVVGVRVVSVVFQKAETHNLCR